MAALSWLIGVAIAWGGDPPPARHEVHASYGRLTVETAMVTIRIRMFQDDLSRALARHAKRDTVDLRARPFADSVAGGYLNQTLLLAADGSALRGTIVSAGAEQEMWWYLIQYPVSQPLARLSIANRVMFELFGDQQNLLKVVAASGDETALYFVPGEPGPVTITVR